MKKINSNSINKYWNKYYKITSFDKQSNFANFVLRKLSIKKKITLADIACGNGRDTVFFHKHGMNIIGFDHSQIIIKNNIKKFGNFFIKVNFCKKNLKLNKKFDVFYIRFFFHAITEKMENEFLLNLKKTSKKKSIFFCEFRTNKDPLIKRGVKISKYERFTTHYRRFIELNSFKKKLDHNKFKIIYEKTSNKFDIKKKRKTEYL